MKRLTILIWLCFAFFVSDSLGQLTFTNPIVSKVGEYTLDTTKSNGQLLTLSTKNSFSWIIPDRFQDGAKVYISLQCVTSGSVVDFGFRAYDKSGYPTSYSQNSQIMPFIGTNFPNGISSDVVSFYYPSKPTRSAPLNIGLPFVSSTGDKYSFDRQSDKLYISVTPFTKIADVSDTGIIYSLGFEILNCGTATWCLQTDSQFQSNPGVCDPGKTQVCQAPPTCATSPHLSDCATDSAFIIDNYLCLSQCPTGATLKSIKSGLSVCECTSPCAGCSGTSTTCTSCIEKNYLYESTCSTSCPADTIKFDDTMTCGTCTSPCAECSGSATKCTSCIANNYLYQSTCSTSCPADTIKFDDTMTCGTCTSPCAGCSGSATKCTSCIANHYLSQDTCVSECPSGYTADVGTGKCKALVTSVSQGIAGWKLGLAIGLPVISVTGLILIGIFIKSKTAAGLAAAAAKGGSAGFQQVVSNPTTPTLETNV